MFRSILCFPIARPFFVHPTAFPAQQFQTFRSISKRYYKCVQMGIGNVSSGSIQQANFRLCNVSGHMTELLEIQAPNPTLHVLFIPGNPAILGVSMRIEFDEGENDLGVVAIAGIVMFYKEFVESLYEQLGGNASITAIGHVSNTLKDWEHGRLFSLQEQIDHKIDFISHELENNNAPVILVGHSVGSHISLEMFKRASHKVTFFIGLYPFLALNAKSAKQASIKKLAESPLLCSLVSSIVALLGLIPSWSRFILKKTIGKTWSATAIEAGCSHLLKYHIMLNMLFMAMTEFQKFSEAPDWEFLKAKQGQIAFLFGIDDHWGPLTLFEEISKQAPNVCLSIEREGHDHAFSVTEAGSIWVAQHVASLIKKHTSKS